jgi:DNA-directed RNA polymerase subunit RPC12/RpoP
MEHDRRESPEYVCQSCGRELWRMDEVYIDDALKVFCEDCFDHERGDYERK